MIVTVLEVFERAIVKKTRMEMIAESAREAFRLRQLPGLFNEVLGYYPQRLNKNHPQVQRFL